MAFTRTIPAIVFLATLLPADAYAQDKCSTPQAVNTIQMKRALNGSDLIPVSVNGVEKLFLFDTGGGITQIGATRPKNCTSRCIPAM